MSEIRIREVTIENADDLCRMCIPLEMRDAPAFVTGAELKRKWATEMLQRWGSLAKLAYEGSTPVGLIQYEPMPEEGVIRIYCIYVPEKEHWQKGIATQMLSSLIEEMKGPKKGLAISPIGSVTRTSREKLGQYPARLFLSKM